MKKDSFQKKIITLTTTLVLLVLCPMSVWSQANKFETIAAAAAAGNAEGQFQLGLCYYDGAGVAKNVAQAIEWYRKAASQGHADAQRILRALGL